MQQIYITTGNPGKLREISSILTGLNSLIELIPIDVDLVEIQGTSKEVIEAKAKEAMSIIDKRPILLEDTSLETHALNGLPGPYIKDFLKHLGNNGIWDLIRRYEDHSAEAVTWFAFVTKNNEIQFFRGAVPGEIVAPKGTMGFGWDPIFKPLGSPLTFGEMNTGYKLQNFSSRRPAIVDMYNNNFSNIFGTRQSYYGFYNNCSSPYFYY